MAIVYFYQSKKEEIETIIWSMKNHELLKKYCDSIFFPKIPKELWQEIKNDNKSNKVTRKIREYLNNKSNLMIKKTTRDSVIPLWKIIEKDYFNKIKQLFKTKPLNRYTCYLTKYGGGGLFYLPRTIFVRVNSKKDVKYFIYTVAHELMHIFIDKEIINMTQDEKEDKVDKALVKIGLFK